MNNHSQALILLSTFNGEKYLEAQLDSIISQSYRDWTLIVRDDGSTDSTIKIIHTYCTADPRIIFMQDKLGNLKIQKSFSALMEYSLTRNEEFIFFCDQDDIWLPNKLHQQIKYLESIELKHGKSTPILVHTDLCVVDSNLKTIHHSYLEFEKLTRNTGNPLKTLLINNYVTGCTIGMNKAATTLATPVPDHAYMHDWWCALCVAATGQIGFLNEATILYRQHNNNSIGSSGFYGKFKDLIYLRSSLSKRKNNIKLCLRQARHLLTRVNETNYHYQIIKNFTSLTEKKIIKRQLAAHQLKLQPTSYLRGMIFRVFLAFI